MSKYKREALGYYCFTLAALLSTAFYEPFYNATGILLIFGVSFVSMTHHFTLWTIHLMLEEEEYE